MPDNKQVFIDTNIWVYLFASSQDAEDQRKNEAARQILFDYPNIVISAQVLNELSNVWLRKYQLELTQIEKYLRKILEIAEIRFLDETLTFRALDLLRSYKLSFYDSLIVAGALESRCGILFSEDMQHCQWIEDSLQIRNPFVQDE